MPADIALRSESPLRWLVLVAGCLALISNYYCYDNPAALKTQLMESTGMDENGFALTYSLYSLPNVVLPFLGGYLCDVYGAARCLVGFAILLTAGQTLFAFGISIGSLNVLLMGRILFGLGGENMTVALSTLLAEWFRGREMAFAMGLFVALARLGSVFNNFASPAIAKSASVSVAVWFGAVLLGTGIVATCAVWWAELHVAKQIRRTEGASMERSNAKPRASSSSLDLGSSTSTSISSHEISASINTLAEPRPDGLRAALLRVTSEGALGPSGAAEVWTEDRRRSSGCSGEAPPSSLPVQPPQAAQVDPLTAVCRFRASFWLLTICCLAIYGCVLPFNNIASSLLMERSYFRPNPAGCSLTRPSSCQAVDNPPNASSACPPDADGYAPPLPANATVGGVTYSPLTLADVDCTDDAWQEAGACTFLFCRAETDAAAQAAAVMSTPYIISAVSSPFLGFAIDRCGGRALIASLSPLVLLGAHLALAYAVEVDPLLPLLGQGVAYSVFGAALWPSVPLTVPSAFEGLAYGLVTAVQNAGLGAFPLLVSAVYAASGQSYIPNVELLFVGFAMVGLAAGVGLQIYDVTHGHILNRRLELPSAARAAVAQAGSGGDASAPSVTPLGGGAA